ncbi:UNVERIFIED_CONTAM: hypothetical protein GTU68_049496 [Idotea baltica]|nr:hypothetical protein [Idotea baltica]
MKKIIIAIDGYSACGKSTLAKDLAKELNYLYIDSGAMYRAVTLHMLRSKIDLADKDAIINELPNVKIHFEPKEEGGVTTFLNGSDVEDIIRSEQVASFASEMSTLKEVRTFLVDQQRLFGTDKGIIMDGRDIGTVVFKDAELKIFLSADIETRAKRRMAELTAKNISISLEEVKKNLHERDTRDTQREESPLFKADDAVLIDNSLLSRDRQKHLIMNLVKGIIEEDDE